MSFIRNAFQTMHPAAQVVMLGCIVLTFMALAAGVGVLWASGGDAAQMQTLMQQGATGELDRSAVLAMNNANQLMAFLGASLAFAALVGMSFLGRFFLQAPALKMLGLAVVIALGMSPVLDFTYRLNEWALVPGSDLHQWAGGLEAQAMVLTKALLAFSGTSEVWAVLFSVAVLPALCEEWLFRGTLQPILVRATGNIHVGIWVSAALFSAIHMQFFGFVPRMLLGAGFGYLVVYSGSLWPAILGSFREQRRRGHRGVVDGEHMAGGRPRTATPQLMGVERLGHGLGGLGGPGLGVGQASKRRQPLRVSGGAVQGGLTPRKWPGVRRWAKRPAQTPSR